MIHLPRNLADASAARGVIRAGGTDLTELREQEISTGTLVDISYVPGLDDIEQRVDGGLSIGAMVTLAEIASHPRIRAGWPALSATAAAIATPQIRVRATLGGSLLQEVRCAYYRSPAFVCSKRGGGRCFAREGDAEHLAVLENGPCIAPHPSSTALALWVYRATVQISAGSPREAGTAGGRIRDIPALLGDGADPRRTHALQPGQILTAVLLPPPLPNDRGGYARVGQREHGEWPLVEAVSRVQLDAAGKMASFDFAVGGVANRPQQWPEAAQACVGLSPDDPRLIDVFSGLLPRFLPNRQAAYKANLLPGVLRESLDRALGRT